MKMFIYIILIFFSMTSAAYSHDLTGKVTDAGGNPVKDAKIYLSFTYPENQYSFFDFISDSTTFSSNTPIRTNYIFQFSLPISGKVNFKIFNRISELVRTMLENDTLKLGYQKFPFDRLTDNGYLLKDDIYINKIDVTSLNDSTRFSASPEKLMLTGLSQNVLFNKDHPLQSWATTDSSGQFKIAVEDLPIGLKIKIENPPSFYDSSVVDSLVGIAVVKGDKFHYDSIRIRPDTNTISMVIDQTTGIETNQNKKVEPDEFLLEQNYPNPFNPQTIIRFQIVRLEDVKIKIYNILGQEVKTLLNKKIQAGSYEVQWDGTDDLGQKVASGIYIYRLETNTGFIGSRKMVYLK